MHLKLEEEMKLELALHPMKKLAALAFSDKLTTMYMYFITARCAIGYQIHIVK